MTHPIAITLFINNTKPQKFMSCEENDESHR